MTALRSRAVVVADVSARYAEQLVSHLGRRTAFPMVGDTASATSGSASGEVVVSDHVLTLRASGPDESSVAQVEHVLGSHPERSGAPDGLTVSWQRSTGG